MPSMEEFKDLLKQFNERLTALEEDVDEKHATTEDELYRISGELENFKRENETEMREVYDQLGSLEDEVDDLSVMSQEEE